MKQLTTKSKFMKRQISIIYIIVITLLVFSCHDDFTNQDNIETVLYESTSLKFTKIENNNLSSNSLFTTVETVKNANDYENPLINVKDNNLFSLDYKNISVNIIIQEVIGKSSQEIDGFVMQSFLMKSIEKNTGEFTLNRYNIYSNEFGQYIQEAIDPFDDRPISYFVKGITSEKYFELRGYNHQFLTNRTTCFSNFNACISVLNTSVSLDAEDSAICDFLPCNAINYAVCVIGQGSGYHRTSSNYIGDNRCDAVYDANGNDVKEL